MRIVNKNRIVYHDAGLNKDLVYDRVEEQK